MNSRQPLGDPIVCHLSSQTNLFNVIIRTSFSYRYYNYYNYNYYYCNALLMHSKCFTTPHGAKLTALRYKL